MSILLFLPSPWGILVPEWWDAQMGQVSLEQPGYLKGKSKHLFWAVLGFLLFSTALEYLQAPLLPVIGRSVGSEALPVVLAVIKTLLLSGIWFAILLLYALASSVKTHKAVILVLAVMEIPAAAGALISNLYLMRVMTGQGGNGNEFILLLGIASALNIIVRAAWVACLAVVVFSKWSGVLLRAAAAVLAVYSVFVAVNALTARYLYEFLYNQFGQDRYVTIITAINILLNIFYLAAYGFFFGALSFGKRRQPKAPPATAVAGSANPS